MLTKYLCNGIAVVGALHSLDNHSHDACGGEHLHIYK